MNRATVFGTHIRQVVRKYGMQMRWILRTFSSQGELTITLYRSLLLPLLECCYQLQPSRKLSESKTLKGVLRNSRSEVLLVRTCYYYWDHTIGIALIFT